MEAVYYSLLLLSSLLLIPVTVIFIQVLLAVVYKKESTKYSYTIDADYTACILIPAHDEEVGLTRTIRSVKPYLSKNHYILVVADNCSDNTSSIAIENLVETIERTDATLKGKCYALEYGFQYLKDKNPDVVVVIDADCELTTEGLDSLVTLCAKEQRPVQCLDLMLAKADASVKTKISAFAWLLKNHIRPLGSSVLKMPCQLMGTGMAIPWSLAQKLNFANGSIVEDLTLGLDCAQLGKPPIFYPFPTVTSYFSNNSEVGITQKSRWEHGHLQVIMTVLPKMLIKSIKLKDIKSIFMIVDAAIPPLALLSMVLALLTMINIMLALHGYLLLGVLSSITVSMFVTSIHLSWYFFGRNTISLKELCVVPKYILGKMPLYLRFLTNKQLSWIKTKRD
ncbi:hypothetical protein NL53_17735 [Vibrio variabilis]|uniref:Glycosyltransferase 2-like domain-containing protein n=1 Tax=Vibrio variabilis TaxID=990271 RepID=A0ABR4Y853_9VIBR|nr:glycosyltransferase family 2 protein [Vibrio variabilis]KHA59182.1 hypothetical protein NL53_17735 [Vibrio variabilis]